MINLRKHLYSGLFTTAALLVAAAPASAQVTLGAASGFSVLGGTNVTCTAGVITGDVGVSPGVAPSFTNTGCTITGSTPPATDAAAANAQTALASAYNTIQQGSCIPLTMDNTGIDPARNPSTLSGVTLAPGFYCIDDVAKTGTLTLNGGPNDVWIFKTLQSAAGDLTGTNFSVAMAGGAQPCNVFWAPATAVTMTTSALKGNILAGNATVGSITLTGGTLAGRALASVAVTMTGASVVGCASLTPGSSSCKGKDHDGDDEDKDHKKCNQGVGNGPEDCDPGHSNKHNPFGSNDENGGERGDPGRKGGNK